MCIWIADDYTDKCRHSGKFWRPLTDFKWTISQKSTWMCLNYRYPAAIFWGWKWGVTYSKAKIVKLHVCVVKVKLLLLPQSTLDPLHWVEFWEGWGQSLSAAAAAKGWPVTLWLPPTQVNYHSFTGQQQPWGSPPLSAQAFDCYQECVLADQWITVQYCRAARVSLHFASKRNETEAKMSEAK